MDPDLLEHVKLAAERTGLAQADILRLCLAIGLEDLRKLDYKIPSVLSEAAARRPPSSTRYDATPFSKDLKVAEPDPES